MTKALQRLQNDKRVESVDDERNIGNGLIVTLRRGYTVDPLGGQHVFGEDNPTKALQYMRDSVRQCNCDECRADAIAKAKGQ